jgi:DNA replication and repair protein RecF
VTAEAPADRELLQARLLEAMARSRATELERGISLVGPHRDDVVLTLGGFPARGYASHGESWSFALALRLGSYELLRSDGGGEAEPVLILDDVFAELDTRRRDRLAGLVAGAEQVLVTAAVAQDVPEALDGARVDVMAGQVRRVR